MPAINNSVPLTSQVYFYSDLSCIKNNKLGRTVYLTPSEKKLFEIILDGKGSKDNIINEIWLKNGTIVGESSYHQLIKMLRRKLNNAGLPCSMIKTIPRYGVVFVKEDKEDKEGGNDESDKNTSELPRSVGDELPVTQLVYTDTTMNEDLLPTDNNEEFGTLSLQDVVPVEPAANENFIDKTKAIVLPKKLALLILMGVILWPSIYLLLSRPHMVEFPLEKSIGAVKFHSFSAEQISSENLQRISQTLNKNVHEVYIAGNGPKIWVAKCNKDITQKDSQCQYEYFSVY
ncbi:winged helix-turn-helix domain-containing protein [Pantoea sp. y20]